MKPTAILVVGFIDLTPIYIMYYKDNYIEFRLGLGIKEFKSISNLLPNFTLIRVSNTETDVELSSFTVATGLAEYPPDGSYKLKVSIVNTAIYYVYFTINDSFLKEFVNQINEVVCKCGCSDDADPCKGNKAGNFALKRQKMFNLTAMLPYTIKPFSYGQGSFYNPSLFSFLQVYYNASLQEKMNELGAEYFNYYIKGNNTISTKLFNDIVGLNYYAVYYYSRKYLLTNSLDNTTSYTKTIDTFFDYNNIKNCLGCSNLEANIEDIMDGSLDPISPLSDVYYWQLGLEDTIETLTTDFTAGVLVNKPSKTLKVFNTGVAVVNSEIGKVVFAITDTPLVEYVITDTTLNSDVSGLFDSQYIANLDILIFVSKAPYSYSTLNLKINKK